MNRRQLLQVTLRAAFVLPATLAAACGGSQSGPAPIATIAVSNAGPTQSAETGGAAKTQTKPTFIEFFAEW